MPVSYQSVDHGLYTPIGPSMAKLIKSENPVGKHFFDFYSVERPYGIVKTEQILPLEGKKAVFGTVLCRGIPIKSCRRESR